jgi:glycosyltransferase involved in cell wall biosynthesis
MQIKILLVNKFFFPKGGSETVFFQEREFLISHGYKVVDFSTQHPENLLSEYSGYFVPNVDYHGSSKAVNLSFLEKFRIATNFIHNSEAIVKLEALIEKEKPQIAHLHNIYHQITPAIITVLKNAGIKVLLTLHDYKLICPAYSMINDDAICNKCEGKYFGYATINRCQEGSYFKSLLLSIEGYWHKWVRSYEGVDLFLSPSKFLFDLMTKNRIGAQKIRVLRNGIDVKAYNFSGQDDGYAIYFGRISKEKGVETLLEAHKLLPLKFSLKIVGTGPIIEELKEKYPEVEFTGYKKGEELKESINRASFVVVPSEWFENCSMSALESMAFGKPVIGSRIGGIVEQIEDGKTGFLFEMGNSDKLARKMTLLAEDKKLRKEMGKAARRKLEREYSLEAHCSKLMEIYEELLK